MAHTYSLGSSGSGKSTLIKETLPEKGFCVLDPHGDLAKEIADSRKAIYWRPADLSYPVGLNPLQAVPPDERWRVTADIVSIFGDIWNFKDAPRMSYYLRASIRLLLDTPHTTLLDIRRVLSDNDYRHSILTKCLDTETRQTWAEFNAKSLKDQTIEVGSLQNKVAALADPLPLRYILGQPTTIDINRVLADGLNLVVDLSGLEGEPGQLLGAIIINTIKNAARQVRQPYSLIIDEFHSFGTHTIASILAEARKWKLSLTVAHQFLEQINPEIRAAILGNCSTLNCFSVGPEDAQIMARAMDCNAKNLQDLSTGQYRQVTKRDGRRTDAFLSETQVLTLPTGYLAGNIKHTRSKLARPRAEVEKLLHSQPSLKKGKPKKIRWS